MLLNNLKKNMNGKQLSLQYTLLGTKQLSLQYTLLGTKLQPYKVKP